MRIIAIFYRPNRVHKNMLKFICCAQTFDIIIIDKLRYLRDSHIGGWLFNYLFIGIPWGLVSLASNGWLSRFERIVGHWMHALAMPRFIVCSSQSRSLVLRRSTICFGQISCRYPYSIHSMKSILLIMLLDYFCSISTCNLPLFSLSIF